MRLPNRYGSVTKLKGRRRNPWMVRKSISRVGPDGKRIMKVVGYAPTRADALDMLAKYNGNPYDLDGGSPTFKEAYNQWYADSFNDETNRSTKKNYSAAFKHCEALHDVKLADIRTADIQNVVDNCPTTRSSANRVKILFNQIYKWALSRDLVFRNYTEGVKVKQEATGEKREAFTKEEIDLLWKEVDQNDYISLILIMIYSGCRINELLNLKRRDVHLKERYFDVVKSKTSSGVRKVPIAEKVVPFWEKFIKRSKCDYAIVNVEGYQLTYDNFKRRYWDPLTARLGIDHIPHETRHTTISLLTMAKVDPTYIKFIVGHKSIMDLTERVYTHISISELINAINSI